MVAVLFACHFRALGSGDDSVRVIEKKEGQTVELWAESAFNTDYLISLSADLQNMTSNPPVPAILDSLGRQRFLVAVFHASDTPGVTWNYHFQWSWKVGRRASGQALNTTFLLPYKGVHKVIQGFLGKFSHDKGSQNEYAVDFEMPEGTTVLAARGGTVTGMRQDSNVGGADDSFKGRENYVIIRHDDGTYAEYAHLRQNGALVKLGQKVNARDPIGLSGSTGHSSQPHLHFMVFNTLDGTTRVAIPIRFQTDKGVVVPEEGASY